MKKVRVTDIMKKVPWVILSVQLILVIYVINVFKVDDTTLYKGDIDSFNTGWTLVRQDGSEELIELPYYEECKADTLITIKNVIPEKYWGKTISFLTADKNVRVYIDGSVIYEFGVNDERTFGQTPGSITNFIDIPPDLTRGEIVIELMSPYDNYGACIDSMTIADRAVSILNMLNRNMLEFGCAIIMLLTAIVFCVLAWSHRWVKHGTEGTEFLAVYSLLSFVYYCIETKAVHLLYGNHTLHSVLVFLILMTLPMFLLTYYMKCFNLENKRSLLVMHSLSVLNACIQIPLQVLNIFDFMEMAFLSHAILFISIVVMIAELYRLQKNGDREHKIEFVGFFIMGLCGVADIVRSYTLTTEHIDKFSRYGTTIFCLLMLIGHIIRIIKRYVMALEENTKLLEQKVKLVESKNEAKSIFLARMSHEIRTPINAVLGMNKMIISETGEDNIREYAKDVESAAQALLGIVNEILDLSKIEAGKMSLAEGEYDVASMLYDVSNMIAVRAQTKDIDFVLNVDDSIPAVLYGDDVKLRQILTNILSNAVKYTNEGLVTMAVQCDRADDCQSVKLTFKIKDTGIGIKEEDMPKLFEAFERIEEGRNRAVEGTGLGMSITVQFLKLMNSSLNVESKYGEGSTFFFTVEQRIVNAEPIGNFSENFRLRRQKYEQKTDMNATGKRVLLVDDNNINRRVFASLLKHTGIQVVEASSGGEALALVTKEQYDIIFLDHMMPNMDGIETLKAFKQLDERENKNRLTPVIALTANAIEGAKAYYMEEGFDGYMSKPIDPDKLDKLIKQYI